MALPLVFVMLLTDSVPNPVPRRVHLAWLLVLLPVLDVVAIASAWACFALDLPGAARYLGLGPWLAGLGIAGTAAVVYSGLVAHER